MLDVIDAGARAAVAESRSRAIGVIGTRRQRSIAMPTPGVCMLDPGARVFQACPLFVPLVERAGWSTRYTTHCPGISQARAGENVDTWCWDATHYPDQTVDPGCGRS